MKTKPGRPFVLPSLKRNKMTGIRIHQWMLDWLRKIDMEKWEYDSVWERIITHDENGIQRVVIDLVGVPNKPMISTVLGLALVEKLNRLRGLND